MRRRDDPLMLLHEMNEQLYNYFEYVPKQHEGGFADRRGAADARGRVPGFRAHHDRAGAASCGFRAAT